MSYFTQKSQKAIISFLLLDKKYFSCNKRSPKNVTTLAKILHKAFKLFQPLKNLLLYIIFNDRTNGISSYN